MKKIGWIVVAVILALAFAYNYPAITIIALVLGAVVAAIILVLKYQEKQAAKEAAAAEQQRQELARRAEAAKRQKEAEERKAEMEYIHREVEARTKRFSEEIEAIPAVSVPVSAPVRRQYIKDMPEYAFSNVTAKTKLSSIFPLVFIDVETTGISPSSCEIIEVSAIKFDIGMKPTTCFTTLCRPKHLIPPEASAINHITDDMVENAPNFKEIAPALSEFVKGCNLAGHNLEFDLRFLYTHGTELPFKKRFYDTLEIAQRTIKRSEIDNHKLETLCSWYGIYRNDAHRSLSDCYATAQIFKHLVFNRTSRDLEKETGE